MVANSSAGWYQEALAVQQVHPVDYDVDMSNGL